MTHPERRGTSPPVRTPAAEPGADDGRLRPEEVVRVTTGRGGLPRVEVRTPSATAEVYLHGAQVTRWAPAGAAPVLWTGARSTFAPGHPIRGGVLVCFPSADGGPAGHGPVPGLACVRPWTFTGWTWRSDDVVLSFVPAWSGPGAAAPPLRVRYTVTVGRSLAAELRVTNTGPGPLRFEDALHTYLAVADVREVRLVGLGDLDRLDRRTGRHARTPAGAQLRVVTETDHLYRRPGAVTVVDWEGQRSLRLRARGASDAVVWNPWADTAATMPDLGADEWAAMVCLVPGNVDDGALVLAPGDQHTLAVTLDVGPLP